MEVDGQKMYNIKVTNDGHGVDFHCWKWLPITSKVHPLMEFFQEQRSAYMDTSECNSILFQSIATVTIEHRHIFWIKL